jgi:hypothetical protein
MESWLFLLLGLILGIPLSIFANFATPWVKSYIDKSFLSSRKKRIESLINEYRRRKKYEHSPFLIMIDGLWRLSLLLGGVVTPAEFENQWRSATLDSEVPV